ncbi:hypothetical protein CRUP_007964 [Coryphaenoides rupestris]|nr:hypothetical protein CRUP_007964 [Coryphaenoides rupestris]
MKTSENEIAVIENDEDGDDDGGFGALEGTDAGAPPSLEQSLFSDGFGGEPAIVNGDMFGESNGPTDSYAAIAQVDQLRQEPESLRKWREEQKERLEELVFLHMRLTSAFPQTFQQTLPKSGTVSPCI